MGGDGEQRWPVVAESAAKSKELEKLKDAKEQGENTCGQKTPRRPGKKS